MAFCQGVRVTNVNIRKFRLPVFDPAAVARVRLIVAIKAMAVEVFQSLIVKLQKQQPIRAHARQLLKIIRPEDQAVIPYFIDVCVEVNKIFVWGSEIEMRGMIEHIVLAEKDESVIAFLKP